MKFPHKIKDNKTIQKNFDHLAALLDTTSFRAVMTSTQSIPTASDTIVVYNSPVGGASPHYNIATGQYRVPKTGWYDFSAGFSLPAPGAGTRWFLRLYVNGSVISNMDAQWQVAAWSNDNHLHGHTGRIFLKQGDLVDIRVNQSSGGSLSNGGGFGTWFAGGRTF